MFFSESCLNKNNELKRKVSYLIEFKQVPCLTFLQGYYEEKKKHFSFFFSVEYLVERIFSLI
jgi:hypothetical protein